MTSEPGVTAATLARAFLALWNDKALPEPTSDAFAILHPEVAYVDPVHSVSGAGALIDAIRATQRSFSAGISFQIASGVDQHHNFCRFSWIARSVTGRVVLNGTSILGISGGKIRQVVSFFGPLPPIVYRP